MKGIKNRPFGPAETLSTPLATPFRFEFLDGLGELDLLGNHLGLLLACVEHGLEVPESFLNPFPGALVKGPLHLPLHELLDRIEGVADEEIAEVFFDTAHLAEDGPALRMSGAAPDDDEKRHRMDRHPII